LRGGEAAGLLLFGVSVGYLLGEWVGYQHGQSAEVLRQNLRRSVLGR